MNNLKRFFCKIGQKMPTDRDGLLIARAFRNGAVLDQEKVLSFRRCCIVGESGIGKTEFIRGNCGNNGNFKVFYASDIRSVDVISRIRKICASRSRKSLTVVLDGIDGSVVGLLSEFVEVMNEYKKIGFIVSATDCSISEYLRKTASGVMQVTMAPLTQEDVRAISEERLGCDECDVFCKMVEKENLGSICRTPLGVNVLCGYWKEKRRLTSSRVELLKRFVADLCENNSNGRIAGNSKYASARYYGCAMTIAGAMLISGCRIIASERGVNTSRDVLTITDVFGGEDVYVAIELLKRAIFAPVAGGQYSFSHRTFFSVLAAEWVSRNTDINELLPVFIDEKRHVVFPQNAEVAGLVALGSKLMFSKMLSFGPEYLALYASEMTDSQKDLLLPSLLGAIGGNQRIFIQEPIRFENFCSRRNKTWVTKQIRHYRSLSENGLRALLLVYRKLNLATESKTMITIVLDAKVPIRVRIVAIPMINAVDCVTRGRLLGLLSVRTAGSDIDELSFKARLVSALFRCGVRLEELLPGIVSMASIDSKGVYSRYLRDLRADFVAMLSSIRDGRSGILSLVNFSRECLGVAVNNYHVKVMAARAFQFAWMNARRHDAVTIVANAYADLLLEGVNPLKFYNRESENDQYLTESKLLADYATRRSVIETIVHNTKIDDSVVNAIACNKSQLTQEDEKWLEQQVSECNDLCIRNRWKTLFDSIRIKSSRAEHQRKLPSAAIREGAEVFPALLKRIRSFPDIVEDIVGASSMNLSCAIESLHLYLSRRPEPIVLKVCDMAKKYLRHSIGSWRGSVGSADIFCALAVVLMFEGDDIVNAMSDKYLERLFAYMLDDGGLLHQRAFSSLISEYEKRFGAKIIDLLQERWSCLKKEGRTSIVNTIAGWVKRSTVEVFKQKLEAGRYDDDFSEAMIFALGDERIPSRCANMRVFAEYVKTHCFDDKGNPIFQASMSPCPG